MYICIDLGGSNIRGTWMDRDGRCGEVLNVPRPRELAGTKKALAGLIQNVMQKSPGAVNNIGIASAGPLNLEQGIYFTPTNMPELKGFDLAGFVSGIFGIRPVLENDAQAAALGEIFNGCLAGEKDALVFTLGTGLGSGVIMDRRVWRGRLDAGPELGHVYMGPNRGKRCGCGQTGCAETWLNAAALKEMAVQNGLSLASLKDLDIYLEKKDEKALVTMQQYGRRLGLFLSQMVSIFGIKNIGLSGGLSRLGPCFSEVVPQSINFRLKTRPWLIPDRIELSPDPQMSALWGMGYLMQQ
ncbi:ROK family protein [Desulfonatronospira sp. MSAO_Bac3]|uniref:ROK family protein n=1 Tax=Desulfonatronospira sp. MSAO_Bac3 TaxID=2293857 RepID=UPI000FF572FA|nr:ROK family protein [Desulfonatronospira sp. MSAO_Bac3]RQD75884.1 MAG: ROK family protein [Desulfonatronospira sp. MSAO_Bac3]